MSEATEPSEAVRRVLFRDDLLTMAAEADRAIGIVRQREALARQRVEDKTLFDLALESQLDLAETDARWAIRTQAWDYAAVLVRFCKLVGTELTTSYTAEQLHERALRELVDNSPPGALRLDKDLTLGVFNRYHAARDLRLIRQYDAALDRVKRPPTDLYGTGAEPHMAHYLYEVGANLISQGRSWDVSRPFEEWNDYWEETRAAGYSTRYRFDFIRALARWNTEPDDKNVLRQLETAVERLRTGAAVVVPAADGGPPDPEQDQGVRELSVLLATAEYLAGCEHTNEMCAKAVELGTRALAIADRVRARWRVIARSRAPLAVVFQRVYGDLALLAHRLPGAAAAELGFKVALSAKQTGFAARIRDGQTFDGNPHIDELLNEIVEIEADSSDTWASNPATRRKSLETLRFELAEAVSPMLADTVFPTPRELTDLVETIGPRHVLDFVELHDTLEDTPRLFRTLIEPGGRMSFELFEPGTDVRTFFERRREAGHLAGRFDRGTSREIEPEESAPPRLGDQIDWWKLANAVLPKGLTDGVLADADRPISLLISAHSWLSLVPWAALKVNDGGCRLVERASLSQCPVLTCLSKEPPPRVTGRALIRLVGENEVGKYGRGVNVDLERQAWGLSGGTAGVPLHECGLLPDDHPQPLIGRFDAALAERERWQFLHIASHGGGKGLDQFLDIPPEPLSAARALGLKWPTSVLMASCHVGLVVNDNAAEPLNFVMALLTGGARCVVAGIDSIDDAGTGKAASHMVRAIRTSSVSLDVALRNAQLAAIDEDASEEAWALLSAYTR